MEQLEDWQKEVYRANLKANSVSFNQGAEHGAKVERDRVVALLEEWVADDNGDFDTVLTRVKEMPEWP